MILKIKILLSIKYDKKDLNIHRSQIEFKFIFLDIEHSIGDWDKYILHKENIQIIFSPLEISKNYYLIDSFSNTTILYSKSIKEIYHYYINYLQTKIDYPLFIRDECRLIDVLENPVSYLNSCINRLVRKYNY